MTGNPSETVTLTRAQLNAVLKAAYPLGSDEERETVLQTAMSSLSVPAAAVVGEPVGVPVPRGGLEPNWWEEWQKIVRKYRRLEKAARFVVSETDRIHDNEPWPLKYQAPYEAITQLRDVLSAAPSAPDGWQSIETAPKDGTRVILMWEPFSGMSEHVELGKWSVRNGWVNTYGHAFSGSPTHWLPTPPALGGIHDD